jgi:hypothetical protein
MKIREGRYVAFVGKKLFKVVQSIRFGVAKCKGFSPDIFARFWSGFGMVPIVRELRQALCKRAPTKSGVIYTLRGPASLSLSNNIFERRIASRERFGFIERKQNAICLDCRLTRNFSQTDGRAKPLQLREKFVAIRMVPRASTCSRISAWSKGRPRTGGMKTPTMTSRQDDLRRTAAPPSYL